MQSANIHQQDIVHHVHPSFTIPGKVKPVISWLAVVAIVTGVFTYLFVVATGKEDIGAYQYWLIMFFLLPGIFHAFLFSKWFAVTKSTTRFIYTLLLPVVVAVIVFTVLGVNAYTDVYTSVAAGVAFLLPTMVQLCWYYFSGVQQPGSAWYIPKNMVMETRMSLLVLNSIPFTIQVTTNEKDGKPLPYLTAFNPKLNLSVIFCRFLYDRQDVIQATNENGEPTGWHFFVKRWYGLQNIDASKSIEKNGVKENDIIVIERV